MTTITIDSVDLEHKLCHLLFVLSRAPRFDVAGPIAWQLWQALVEQGRSHSMKVTWIDEDPCMLLWIQGSRPWEALFERFPAVEEVYRHQFWTVDATYPDIVAKMDKLNDRLAYR